ncbi:hypothetical protein FF38_10617 [Lucilia cuprina]|uniref:Uncharacterized protein n=1 Tax=Lucilia cuprina TaxID=7375 RepID=A0A0L0BX07_LUCCU|nr:hypothetical protein FF38_10617 [Lucilia cuprina]
MLIDAPLSSNPSKLIRKPSDHLDLYALQFPVFCVERDSTGFLTLPWRFSEHLRHVVVTTPNICQIVYPMQVFTVEHLRDECKDIPEMFFGENLHWHLQIPDSVNYYHTHYYRRQTLEENPIFFEEDGLYHTSSFLELFSSLYYLLVSIMSSRIKPAYALGLCPMEIPLCNWGIGGGGIL